MIREILTAMRPAQWIKNLFVFTPLLFSQNLFSAGLVALSFACFAVFCAASGSVYLVNDVLDREMDRCHPAKADRPVAAGRLSVRAALITAVMGMGVSAAAAWVLSVRFFAFLMVYLAVNLLYSLFLKDLVILDVMLIAAGFVLRVMAGSAVISVLTSHWLILCTGLIALFLGFSKRRHELVLQENQAGNSRKVLGHYSPYFLDQMIAVVTASTVMSYALYTVSPETVQKFGTGNLIYTIPFVLYGIFRYLYLVHRKEKGGNPTRVMLTDGPIITTVVLWCLAVIWVLYG